jgi:DNA-binding NtrC family response regulator
MLFDPRTRRILVATSDAITRDVLAEVLADEGYAVHVAIDAPTTKAAVDAFQPHVVLADLDLRHGGATSVIDHVAVRSPHTRVGLLTTLLDLEARRIADDLGAAGHINRPLDLGRVLEVARYLAGLVPP